MKKIAYMAIVFILSIFLVSPVISSNVCTNNTVTTIKNNLESSGNDIEILDVYLEGKKILVDVINNEKSELTMYVDFYKISYPDGITPTYVVSNKLVIPPGEIKQTYLPLPSYTEETFQLIVLVGSESELLEKPRRTYDESWDNWFYWNRYIGWEIYPGQENDFEVTTNIEKLTNENEKPYHITISLTNIGAEEIQLSFETTQVSDFQVYHIEDQHATPVYQWSEHQDFYYIPANFPIKAGQTLTILDYKWNKSGDDGKKLSSGEYLIDGLMFEYYRGGDKFLSMHDFSPVSIEISKEKNKISKLTILDLIEFIFKIDQYDQIIGIIKNLI